MTWTTGVRKAGTVVRISIGMTDEDVLLRLAAITGVGDVKPIKHQLNKLGTKPIWHWYVGGKANARELANRLYPWLGARRRQQADILLAATEDLVIQPEGFCMNGHPIVDGNRAGGGKACKICANARRRERLAA